MSPMVSLIGKTVKAGDIIGEAQSLLTKYAGITNHIHLETKKNDMQVDPKTLLLKHVIDQKIKTRIFSLILFILMTSASCLANDKFTILNKSSQFSNHKLFISVKMCSALYENGAFSIIEVHCNSQVKKDGIYIIDPSGIRYFNWYSPEFNSWSWSEKCRSDKDCYYLINLNNSGYIDTIKFFYYINMSEGFYSLKIDESNLVILKKFNADIP